MHIGDRISDGNFDGPVLQTAILISQTEKEKGGLTEWQTTILLSSNVHYMSRSITSQLTDLWGLSLSDIRARQISAPLMLCYLCLLPFHLGIESLPVLAQAP